MYADIKIFVRNLWRNKLYSVITIGGFALALMFVILLTAYIRQELSVDQFHANKDRIYRAVSENIAFFAAPVGERLKNSYPEVETYSRFVTCEKFAENPMQEKLLCNAVLVDSSFFRMFSFRMLKGNPDEVFHSRNNVVLTKSYALKIFGKTDVVGDVLRFDERDFLITGILEDIRDNTHFDKFDVLLRFDNLSLLWEVEDILTDEGYNSFALYMMGKPGINLQAKTGEMLRELKENYSLYQQGYMKEFDLEPLPEVYWSHKIGLGTHNNRNFIFVLMAIVLVILVLAFINYTNLSLARAGFRAKEAAVKKLTGMTNRLLFRQFVTESVLLCCFSFFIAFALAGLAVPLFNQVLNTEIRLEEFFTGINIIFIITGIGLLGIFSGLLPAWMVLRFNPVEVVKGSFRKKVKGTYGKILISFQYTITIVLIICTLIIFRQTQYMRHYKLGFNHENVVRIAYELSSSQQEVVRSELLKIPEVVRVSFAQGDPVDGGSNRTFKYRNEVVSFNVFRVDSSFFKLLDIRVTPTGAAQSGNGIYLNQVALKELELGGLPTEFAISPAETFPVVGVTDNVHFSKLTERIGMALVLPLQNQESWSVLVKVNTPYPGRTYDKIKKTFSDLVNGVPFDSGFMDVTINQWYRQEEQMACLIGYFSVVSIMLSMMGILAMATYYIRQRVKEIGVRRVNGASVREILEMLTGNFMSWVLVAFVIACPVAWYAMNSWLQDFPYRAGMNIGVYIGAGMFVALGALLMVGWQSFKAATENPVHSLKNE